MQFIPRVVCSKQMETVSKYLSTLDEPRRANYNWLRLLLPVHHCTGADGRARIALARFIARLVGILTVLPCHNLAPVSSRLNHRVSEQLNDFAHRSESHLSWALAKYCLEISMPTDFRPRFLAVIKVVPVPQKGSSAMPPSGQVASRGRRQRSIG